MLIYSLLVAVTVEVPWFVLKTTAEKLLRASCRHPGKKGGK